METILIIFITISSFVTIIMGLRASAAQSCNMGLLAIASRLEQKFGTEYARNFMKQNNPSYEKEKEFAKKSFKQFLISAGVLVLVLGLTFLLVKP